MSLLLALSSAALAQDPAVNPQLASQKAIYIMVRTNVLKSTDSMPEAKYGYKPVDSVRSFAQQLMHVADAQYFMCNAANGDPAANRGIEKSNLKTKAEIVKALTDAYAFCDALYVRLTDASSARDGRLPRAETHQARGFVAQYDPHHGALWQYSDLPSHERDRAAVKRRSSPGAAKEVAIRAAS